MSPVVESPVPRSPRDAYGPALLELGRLHPELVVLDGDKNPQGTAPFAEAFPDRYFRSGVSEQGLVLTAAGLAIEGRTVFVGSFASHLVGRAYDQIRTAVAIPNLPVHLVATRGGITAGDGASGQMIEDFALMRALPQMAILAPADYGSAFAMILALGEHRGPSYLRLGSVPLPALYAEGDRDFAPGGARLLREGGGVTLCACGIMVREALRAAEILSRQGIEADVIDCYGIKPLPEQTLIASIRRTGCCVVCEEHSRIGGLGGAIAERSVRNDPVPIRFVAVEDRFGQSGRPEEIQEYYGLTHERIVGAAAQVWALRRR